MVKFFIPVFESVCKMESISTDLLEDVMTYNNELTCVQETIAKFNNSKYFVVTNTENGRTTEELVEPFEQLFTVTTKKPYCDIEYIQRKRPDMQIDVTQNCNDVNVFDLNNFLQAIVPKQMSLLEILEEQCNIYPEYTALTEKLQLINTPCSRPFCQGKILAGTKLTMNNKSSIEFAVAHPPFVYEIKKILQSGCEMALKTYMKHLSHYLHSDISNDSCLLCLTYDLYCTDTAELKNFRLFFLETVSRFPQEATAEYLYESRVSNKVDQCFVFDELLQRINLIGLRNAEDNVVFVVRYWDDKKQESFLFS